MNDITKETIPNTTHDGQNDCHEFWNSVESITGFVVPTYIRNVLKLHGFDSAMSLKLIDEDDIKEMENFAKSGGMLRTLVNGENKSDFYGPFVKSIAEFQILRGYRKVLLDISAFIREKESQNINDRNNAVSPDEVDNNAFHPMKNSEIQKAEVNFTRKYLMNFSHTKTPISTKIISRSTPTTSIVVTDDRMSGSSEENPSSNVKKETKELPKISVRRKCVLLKSSLHRHPISRLRPWPVTEEPVYKKKSSSKFPQPNYTK